jgi:hypothetical protein
MTQNQSLKMMLAATAEGGGEEEQEQAWERKNSSKCRSKKRPCSESKYL